MERGICHINNDIGAIDTQKLPKTVYLARGSFPKIYNEDIVWFERFASNPNWAATVVRATEVDRLLALGAPQVGLTRGAQELLLKTAVRFVAEAQVAPTVEQAHEHLAFASDKMASVTQKAHSHTGRMGVVAVRDALK